MGHLREGRELDVTVEPVTLALDAVDVPAVHARPDGMPRAGVVLHPDIGGLRPLFDDMARRLATHGLAVCAVEPFAGVAESRAGDDRAAIRARRGISTTRSSSRCCRARPICSWSKTTCRGSCVLGFCMGGHYTFKAAASDRFDAAVVVLRDAAHARRLEGPGPHDRAARRSPTQMCPTLAIFGSVDPWTPAADIDALRAAWSDRPDCEIVVVEGADHGFVHDPDRPAHRAADAAACWDRAITWMLG